MNGPKLKIVLDKETDGRWIAEVPTLPGALAYGATQAEAKRKVSAIALRTIADKMERGGMRRVATQLFAHDKVAGR